jgi:hypothetical protein
MNKAKRAISFRRQSRNWVRFSHSTFRRSSPHVVSTFAQTPYSSQVWLCFAQSARPRQVGRGRIGFVSRSGASRRCRIFRPWEPCPSPANLALFRRGRFGIEFVITLVPPALAPSCRYGQIGFVWRDSMRLQSGAEPNWVCFARFRPPVPRSANLAELASFCTIGSPDCPKLGSFPEAGHRGDVARLAPADWVCLYSRPQVGPRRRAGGQASCRRPVPNPQSDNSAAGGRRLPGAVPDNFLLPRAVRAIRNSSDPASSCLFLPLPNHKS